MIGAVALAAGLLACDDFPHEPEPTLTIVMVDWPDTLSVTDVITLELEASILDANGDTVYGSPLLSVEWSSSDPNILDLEPEEAVELASGADSLAQLRARATARQRGTVEVRAEIQRRDGTEAEVLRHTIIITEHWVAVALGSAHTCGQTTSGEAFCWGRGVNGQLGYGSTAPRLRPTKVIVPGGLRFVELSAGTLNSCGIVEGGVAHCWGSGLRGQIGNDDPTLSDQLTPAPLGDTLSFHSISAGETACGIVGMNLGFCWGSNSRGALGVGPSVSLETCVGGVECSRSPMPVGEFPNSPTFSALDVTFHRVCGITESDGTALCWGDNSTGALGNGSTDDSSLPEPVVGGLEFVSISMGRDHTCGISPDSALYCWGRNQSDQLGVSSSETCDFGFACSTVPLRAAATMSFTSVSPGEFHTCALSEAGYAYCWGGGEFGQLGNGATMNSLVPVPVSAGLQFGSLSAGSLHTCGVTTDGSIYCWGIGAEGQLGNGPIVQSPVPVRVGEPE